MPSVTSSLIPLPFSGSAMVCYLGQWIEEQSNVKGVLKDDNLEVKESTNLLSIWQC